MVKKVFFHRGYRLQAYNMTIVLNNDVYICFHTMLVGFFRRNVNKTQIVKNKEISKFCLYQIFLTKLDRI